MTRRKGKGKDETRVGNYLFSIQQNSSGSWLVASTVSGLWSIRWNDGHMMYGILIGLIADVKCHAYIDALMTMIYTASSYPHDMASLVNLQQLPFIDGFCELVRQQTDREVSFAEKPTGKEEKEALDETVQLREIEEELEALDEDEVHRGRT